MKLILERGCLPLISALVGENEGRTGMEDEVNRALAKWKRAQRNATQEVVA